MPWWTGQEDRRLTINSLCLLLQTKVREATSNDAWGPSGTQMNEIAQLTYNQLRSLLSLARARSLPAISFLSDDSEEGADP